MANTIHIQVEDVDTKLTEYDQLELHRATSLNGTYLQVDVEPLVAGQYTYSILDSTGSHFHFYKYRFSLSGANGSEFSDAFRVPGVTRKDIRQHVLRTYRAGMVFAASGGDVNTVNTTDYRVKSSGHRVGRGMGQWLLPVSGDNAGMPAMIKSDSTPTTGAFNVEVDWPNAISADDEIEWHYLVEPDVINEAINEAMKRYWYIDTIGIEGVPEANEYDLADYAPWVNNRNQIHSMWYYPSSNNAEREGVPLSWGSQGSWWNIRQDAHSFKIIISPAIDATTTLWLETSRQLPELLTDEASVPEVANLDLIAAFVWDEVLAFLTRPVYGTAEDTKAWEKQRVLHATGKLIRLINENRPRPRPGIAPSSYPDVTFSRARAR